jgi:hypothetical protein
MEANDPKACFGQAVSTGTQAYNHTKKPVEPSPQWNSYVRDNYHAAKQSGSLPHGETMRSLSKGYRNMKGV